MTDRLVHALLHPLDRARLMLLHALGPLARPLMVRRDLRVALWGTTIVASSFVGAVYAPLLLLALGPVLLGVPHLLSDVRYLVVRPGHHRNTRLLPAAALLACAAVTASVEAGVAAAIAGTLALPRTLRRDLVLAALAVVAAVALAVGPIDRLVFAHAHNVIALVLWWLWRPARPTWHLLPVALFVAASLAIGVGVADAGLGWLRHAMPAGLGPGDHEAVLAPGVAWPWAGRLVILFAFAQSVHYGVWLRLVPEDDRRRPTPRTWRATWRALVDDFGRPALYATLALSIGLVGWAVFDLAQARDGYLRLAVFHGHMELMALALLAAAPAAARRSTA